jgi:hypothetical protein
MFSREKDVEDRTTRHVEVKDKSGNPTKEKREMGIERTFKIQSPLFHSITEAHSHKGFYQLLLRELLRSG